MQPKQVARQSGFMAWIDERFPFTETLKKHITEYYAPKNFNFWYYFGSLALLVFVLQIVTGNLEICTGTGRTVDRVTSARLCRCGHSATKPFCDNTHLRIGFEADGN